ncbi:MAG: hypothetical protein Q7O66_23010 [Dehalococcoidia bacterium]|nr:hypothetical protein [Dehalococcoidia bacterium]
MGLLYPLHEEVRAVFKKSLPFARQTGHLKSRKIKAVLDTSNILGQGAVKDTYPSAEGLADGIVMLSRVLAGLAGTKLVLRRKYGRRHTTSRGALVRRVSRRMVRSTGRMPKRGRSFWSFGGRMVGDADRLLELARRAMTAYASESDECKEVVEAADSLSQLLLQDVERKPEGVSIKEGVSRDRVVSVHDAEMRHGRKSKSKLFDGHKAAVAVDPDSQLITAAAVLAGNAPDKEQAMELVKQTEENAQVEVEETIGDCAYGAGTTRQEFADADRKLVAILPLKDLIAPIVGRRPKKTSESMWIRRPARARLAMSARYWRPKIGMVRGRSGWYSSSIR